MKQKQIIINNFSGGISNDVREQSGTKFAISQHFDNTTSPQRLVPFRDSEDDNTTQVGIMNFAYVPGTNDNSLYGLGITLTGGLKIQLYKKTGDDISSAWSTPADSTSTNATHPIGNTFIWYKDLLYFNRYTNSLNTYNTLTSTFDNTGYALSGATSFTDGSAPRTQGVIHSKSDNLYIGFNNFVWKNDNVTTPGIALTLPSNFYISSMVEYGSYLAIGCRQKSGIGNSKVFLWDVLREEEDPQEVLDFGVGDLWILGNVEGRLVAVMNESSSSGITFPKKKVYIKTYAGGSPTLFKTLEDTDLSLMGLLGYKPYYSNINGLTFGLYSTGEKVPTGLYTFSRGAGGQDYQVTSSRLIHNNTTITNLVGIYKVGDVVFTAYNYVADTSSNVGRTENTEIYTNDAYYISQKFNDGDTSMEKSLDAVAVFYPPLPSGASVTLSFRKNEETAWTEIFTDSTLNSVSHEALNIEPDAVNFDPFNEIQFKIESTGGAEITGFKFLYTPVSGLIN